MGKQVAAGFIKKDKLYHRFEIKKIFWFQMVGKEINLKMYLENFILNDTINNNLTVRSHQK